MARYQEILGVEIYAYCVLGNHYHLLVKAPRGNIDEFCENVNREIARRINWKYHREGKLWTRRYDDQEVLSDEDILEAFLYINTNPSRHGLIKNSAEWTGLNSFEHCLNEQDRSFSFHHYSEQRATKHRLKLSILPCFKALSRVKRNKTITKLLKARLERISEERNGNFMGLNAVLQVAPGEKPLKVSKSPKPSCYTISAKLRREFLISQRLRRQHYDEASCKYRLGLNTIFPAHTFKPPLHRLPRLVRFTPLTVEQFQNAA